jgi:hypothetical protein
VYHKHQRQNGYSDNNTGNEEERGKCHKDVFPGSIMHWLSFNNRRFTFHGTGEAQWAGCVPAHTAIDAPMGDDLARSTLCTRGILFLVWRCIEPLCSCIQVQPKKDEQDTEAKQNEKDW